MEEKVSKKIEYYSASRGQRLAKLNFKENAL